MIDLSDGLATDAGHLARAQRRRGCELDLEALPLAPGVDEVAAAAGSTRASWPPPAGEDYELLFTLPPRTAGMRPRGGRAEAGARATRLGSVLEGRGVLLLDGVGGRRGPPGLRAPLRARACAPPTIAREHGLGHQLRVDRRSARS